MLRCTRCQVDVPEDRRICRRCGAILQEVEVPPEMEAPPEVEGAAAGESVDSPPERSKIIEALDPAGSFDEVPVVSEGRSAGPWDCPSCAEAVDAGFDVCWSCGTDRHGVEDPSFARVSDKPDSDLPTAAAPGIPVPPPSARVPFGSPCPRCGSRKVIPGAFFVGRRLVAPDADDVRFAFATPSGEGYDHQAGSAAILGETCGACGHVELRVRDPHELFTDYVAQFE